MGYMCSLSSPQPQGDIRFLGSQRRLWDPAEYGCRHVSGSILLLANSASCRQLKKLSAFEACMLEPHRVAAAALATRRMMRDEKGRARGLLQVKHKLHSQHSTEHNLAAVCDTAFDVLFPSLSRALSQKKEQGIRVPVPTDNDGGHVGGPAGGTWRLIAPSHFTIVA